MCHNSKRFREMSELELENNINLAELKLNHLSQCIYMIDVKEFLANVDMIWGEAKGYTQDEVDLIKKGDFELPKFISVVQWKHYIEKHSLAMRERLLSKQWVDKYALLSSYKNDRFVDNIHAKHLNWLIHNREFVSNGSKYYLTNNNKGV